MEAHMSMSLEGARPGHVRGDAGDRQAAFVLVSRAGRPAGILALVYPALSSVAAVFF
jgi:hypothetical protein